MNASTELNGAQENRSQDLWCSLGNTYEFWAAGTLLLHIATIWDFKLNISRSFDYFQNFKRNPDFHRNLFNFSNIDLIKTSQPYGDQTKYI